MLNRPEIVEKILSLLREFGWDSGLKRLREEIATTEADELPRPLRNAAFGEDIWNPFIRFNFAILVCFWPEIFLLRLPGPAFIRPPPATSIST